MVAEIKVDLGKRCSRCNKLGATGSGLCLACIRKGIKRGDYDKIIDRVKGGENLATR